VLNTPVNNETEKDYAVVLQGHIKMPLVRFNIPGYQMIRILKKQTLILSGQFTNAYGLRCYNLFG